MAGTATIEEVNLLIAQHSDKAINAIRQLASWCQQDESGQTPLNTAIQVGNDAIIKLLAESDETVNFVPKIDEDLLAPVKHTVAAMFNGQNVEDTEKHLRQMFGPRMCWQRTPLHTACRYANAGAAALLISRNADLKASDILGLTPLELCVQFGGLNAVNDFISSCSDHKKKLPVTEPVLKIACSDPILYKRLIELGSLDSKAKRFAFNLACALLDKQGIDHILEQGMDINKTMNDEFSPILEVCTSRLLTFVEHPEASRLAGRYAAASNTTTAIHIDNEAILNAESPEDIENLFDDAFKEEADKQAEQTSYPLSKQECESQLAQRLSLIDSLCERGLDVGIAESKAPYGFVGDLVSTNTPQLLQALVSKGFSLAPDKGDEGTEILMALTNGQYAMVDPLLQLGHKWKKLKKERPDLIQEHLDWKQQHPTEVFSLELPGRKRVSAARHKVVKAIRKSKWAWELAGESALLAETDPKKLAHDKTALVRLTHNNVYGPVDGVQFFVRIASPDYPTAFGDPDSGIDWQPMKLVEELLSIEGEEVERSSISEPIYDETPWEATYECELIFNRGKHLIEIKCVSDIEGMAGVLSDWLVTVD